MLTRAALIGVEANLWQSATRTSLDMYANVTGNTGGNSWSGHRTAKGIGSLSNIRLGYSNYSNAHPEAEGGGSFTLNAVIEYPPGRFTAAKWSGASSIVVAPGDHPISDPMALTIPEDTYFQVHTHIVGAAWSEALMPTRAASNEGMQRGATTDRTQTSVGMSFNNSQPSSSPTSY
jgi:hypothetical protein